MAAYDPRDSDDAEPPLDPAAERVRRKLAGLLFGSLGVMVLGLVAVFSAILYKVGYAPGNAEEQPGAAEFLPGSPVQARLAVPAGAQVVSMSLDGSRALLHLRQADGSEGIVLVDLPSGAILGRYNLSAP